MEATYQTTTRCRICREGSLSLVLDLGSQPPANSLRSRLEDPLPEIPLRLGICRACRTVQLLETTSAEYLFSEYTWVTGTSRAAREHSRFFHREALRRCGAGRKLVVEVASNDGTFLRRFQEAGDSVLGIDPAANIARTAQENGIPTMPEFFGLDAAERILRSHGPADCLIARNVVPHVADVHGVIGGMARLLAPSGVGIIEFHYGLKILEELHYDSIYHEHLFYFSLRSLSRLLEMHGLHPFDILESPISGGSKVVYLSLEPKEPSRAYAAALTEEDDSGLNEESRWQDFAGRSRRHRDALAGLVRHERARGLLLIGCGASARSSTLLNFCGLDGRFLEAVADAAPLKQGKWTPGSNLPILPPEAAFALNPDVVLLLAWNLEPEIMETIRGLFDFRGPVIVPLPTRVRVEGTARMRGCA